MVVPVIPTSARDKKLKNARNGAILQMVEAATLGMPLEVWKTHMGRHRNEGNIQALMSIYNKGGRGFSGVHDDGQEDDDEEGSAAASCLRDQVNSEMFLKGQKLSMEDDDNTSLSP